MTRSENDLRDALRELERCADEHGAPSAASILETTSETHHGASRRSTVRWLAPLAAAAAVATVAAVTVAAQHSGSTHRSDTPAAGHSTTVRHPVQRTTPPAAASILADAATKLDSAPWTAPAAHDFYYLRTTEATTWTSVSGTRAGSGHNTAGEPITVPGCVHGALVAPGESGNCTLLGIPHYLADAPTAPQDWNAYLERIAPGARAGGAQGKIIVSVLHQYLVAPKAAAALLRYTESCPGLHAIDVAPVSGERLVGISCTTMTNGSYGLAFDAATHAFAGFVPVTADGSQAGAAEIVLKTAIVGAAGQQP